MKSANVREIPTGMGSPLWPYSYWGLLLCVTAVTGWILWPYLLTVFLGGVLALICRSPYKKLCVLLKDRRRTSALIIVLADLLLIAGPVAWFLTEAIRQAVVLGNQLTKHNFSFERISTVLSTYAPVRAMLTGPEQVEMKLREIITNAGTALSKFSLYLLSGIPDSAIHILLALVACYFFLIDGRRFLNWLQKRIPLDPQTRTLVFESMHEAANSSILAGFVVGFVQASIMALGYLVLGVPGVLLAAAATFLLAWIPFVGSTPVWVVGIIYLWIQSSPWAAAGMLAFGAITGVSDNIVRTWVLNGRGGLHPLIGLLAIFGGLSAFGIFGVFVGPIVVSLWSALLEVLPAVAKQKNGKA